MLPRHAVRLDVQGLRALAVVLVVLSHAGMSHFAGGYVGVDVFFVISGFLVTGQLVRELTTAGRISIRSFYARRALRLLPAATLVTVTTLVGAWFFLSKIRFSEYVADALGSALYGMNFRLAITGTDYLAQGSPPSPFQHFWSLAVEEQFYVLWPLLLLLSWPLARRRGLLAVPLGLLCLVSFALSVHLTGSSPSWAYFGTGTRMWELGVGSLLALAVDRWERIPGGVSAPMTWLGLVGIAVSGALFDNDTPFPGYHALLPVLGAALVVAGGCARVRHDARMVLARRPMVWLGGLSYGWYLWHWPFLIIGPRLLNRAATVPLSLGLAVAALLAAWATLRVVENPLRFHPLLRRRPARALGWGSAFSVGAVVITLVAGAFPPAIDSGAPAVDVQHALATASHPQSRLAHLLDTFDTRLPSNLRPALGEIKGTKSAIYRDGCHVNFASTATPSCVYGERSSPTVVVLFGDSHAAQWFPALEPLARARGWKLVSLTKASCKIAEAETTIKAGKPYQACEEWRKKALAEIEKLHPAMVIASSSDAGKLVDPVRDPLEEWTAGFRRTFEKLAGTGAEVTALLDTPWPKGDAVDCAAANPLRLNRCTNDASRALHDRTMRTAVKNAAQTTEHVSVIDPVPWLCTHAGRCPVAVGNTLLYRDESHVSETYAESIAPVLGMRISELFDGGRRPARPWAVGAASEEMFGEYRQTEHNGIARRWWRLQLPWDPAPSSPRAGWPVGRRAAGTASRWDGEGAGWR